MADHPWRDSRMNMFRNTDPEAMDLLGVNFYLYHALLNGLLRQPCRQNESMNAPCYP